jgi:hypothetical protein
MRGMTSRRWMVLVAVVAMLLGIARPRTPRVPSLESAENQLCHYVASPGEPPFDKLDSDGNYGAEKVSGTFIVNMGALGDLGSFTTKERFLL